MRCRASLSSSTITVRMARSRPMTHLSQRNQELDANAARGIELQGKVVVPTEELLQACPYIGDPDPVRARPDVVGSTIEDARTVVDHFEKQMRVLATRRDPDPTVFEPSADAMFQRVFDERLQHEVRNRGFEDFRVNVDFDR